MASYLEKRGRKTFLVTPGKLKKGEKLKPGQSLKITRKRLTPAQVLIYETTNKSAKSQEKERSEHQAKLKEKLVFAGFQKI